MWNNAEGMNVPKEAKAIDVVLSDLETVAQSAEALADRIVDRLAPISLPERASLEKQDDNKQVEKALPPLFTDIRSRYRRIKEALLVCECALDRLEV